ncbi:MAG: MarR family transcriptional regulator [Crocinitomicaceae bacterium]
MKKITPIEKEIQSTFKNEYHKLLVNIHLTSSRLGEVLQEEMKKHDITSTQYNVLRILRGQHPNAVNIGVIKERMIERSSDVSRIIERLVKKNLIERKENQQDRRQKDVRISDKGLQILAETDKIDHHIKDLLGHLSNSEAQQLNTLLDKARASCPKHTV